MVRRLLRKERVDGARKDGKDDTEDGMVAVVNKLLLLFRFGVSLFKRRLALLLLEGSWIRGRD
jgi:hypothetical protein